MDDTPNRPLIQRYALDTKSRPIVGLALGGGVARGWAHIGVIRALLELGIVPDIICGTSVGALVGGCYLAGHLDTLETWARSLNKPRLLSYLDLFSGGPGLMGGKRLAKEMEKHLGRIESKTWTASSARYAPSSPPAMRFGCRAVISSPRSARLTPFPAHFRRSRLMAAGSSTARSSIRFR